MNVVPITYISLFSGGGGLDLGLRISCPSARCLCYVERSIETAEVLAARIAEGAMDDAPIWSCVTTFQSELYRGRVDVIEGGFPCTDLSVAGKRAGIGAARSGLWHEYARIIEEVQPEVVIVENVGGLLSSRTLLHRGEIMGYFDEVRAAATCAKERWYAERHIERLHRRLLPIHGISALLYVQCCLGQLGYESEAGFFTASEVGASHKRERVFIVGYKPGSGILRQLANGPSGGYGESRESPRGDGLADGGDCRVENARYAGSPHWRAAARRETATDIAGRSGEPELGDANGDNERRASESAMHGERQPAGGSGWDLEHAASPRRGRAEDAGASSGDAGEDGGRSAESLRGCDTTMDAAGYSDRWALSERGGGGCEGIDAGREEAGGAGVAVEVLADTTNDNGRGGIDGAKAGVGADGIGWRGSAIEGGELGNTDEPGLERWELSGGGLPYERAAGPASDTELADATSSRRQPEQNQRRICGEVASTGEVGIEFGDYGGPSGERQELADDPQSRSRGVPEPDGRDDAADAGWEREELADANSERRQQVTGSAPCDEEADGGAGRLQLESDGDNEFAGDGPDGLPVFAPGPGATERWQRIIAERPWLAPAISKEEAESIFRGIFAGRSDEFDIEDRTHRLRALGNMASPVQAAFSIVTLAQRALTERYRLS